MNNEKKGVYEAPQIENLELAVEKGFSETYSVADWGDPEDLGKHEIG